MCICFMFRLPVLVLALLVLTTRLVVCKDILPTYLSVHLTGERGLAGALSFLPSFVLHENLYGKVAQVF